MTIALAAEADHPSEGHLDVILLQELAHRPDLSAWLAKRLGLDGYALKSARRSWVPSTSNPLHREIDLRLIFEQAGRETLVLVENKIAAPFQPGQPEFYRDFAVKHGRAITVLFAPARYLAGAEATMFGVNLSYEELREFVSQGGCSPVAVAFLDAAISDNRQYYIAKEDQEVTRFWRYYSQRLLDTHQLMVSKGLTRVRPRDSDWPQVKVVGMDSRFILEHKLRDGQVRLVIRRARNLVPRLKQALVPLLPKDALILPARQSASIVIPVVPILRAADPEAQLEAIDQAALALGVLSKWYRAHENSLRHVLEESNQ